MINPWFKFYGGEYLSDPKIGTLTPQERSCWITLLCMANTSSVAGLIEYLTVEVLLDKSGIHFDPYHPEEWDKCLSVLQKFDRMKMVRINEGGSIEIVNWQKRQETSLTATERSRRYRSKYKGNLPNATEATKRNENATIEENRIEENREDNTDTNTRATKKVAVKKIKKIAVHNPLGAEIIKALIPVNPACRKYYENITQRSACDRLIKEYGLERVKSVIAVLPRTNPIPWIPTITTPLQLEDKWVSLHVQLQKEQAKQIIGKNGIA